MVNQTKTFEITAKTFYGLEAVLAKEIELLGGQNIQIANRAVTFKGDTKLLYKANIYLRTALSVLKPLISFNAKNEDELYNGVLNFDWTSVFDISQTFVIDHTVNSTYFKHSQYAALKTKDAIADCFRKRLGKRPYVNVPNPDVIIQLHITGNYITLSLNSSGEPLFKRGYRTEVREAPLNEVLAAGLILLSEWDCNSPFVDPMCGSGTLPIEAALIANQTPPGIFREDYGFKRWNNYDEEIFNKIISDWKTIKRKDLKIYGFDKAPSAIRSARNNSARARLAGAIDWQIKSLEELENFQSPGIIITNPPYGVRLDETNLNELYQLLGSTFKHKFVNYNAWIISSNSEAFNHIGLKTSNRIKLMNGPLECFFNKYELFDGSRKIKN